MAATEPSLPATGGPMIEDYSGRKDFTAPVVFGGKVVKGFGRGSKDLGIPTANLPLDSLGERADAMDSGIYFGWATVDGDGPYKMVMSVGWNPFYKNKHKTIEPHLLHDFAEDFYGSELRVIVCGYLRPEKSYDSLEALIAAIKSDVTKASLCLDEPALAALAADPTFRGER